VKYFFLKILKRFYFLVALLKIKKLKKINFLIMLKSCYRKCSIEKLVDFILIKENNIIRSSQINYEISGLLGVLEKVNPTYIIEIGTLKGGTLFLFTKVASPTAKILTIDLPGGNFGGGYSNWRRFLYKSFGLPKQKIFLLREDSHSPMTLRKVNSILKDKKIDFLFIDGDHSYEGVKRDFEMYAPLVVKGGIIAFHDIVPHPPVLGCEVSKFWNEIKYQYNYREIIKDKNQGWAGIGVLKIN